MITVVLLATEDIGTNPNNGGNERTCAIGRGRPLEFCLSSPVSQFAVQEVEPADSTCEPRVLRLVGTEKYNSMEHTWDYGETVASGRTTLSAGKA